MSPKDVDRMANKVDPDQTAPRSSLIRAYFVCPYLSVPIFRIIIQDLPSIMALFFSLSIRACVKVLVGLYSVIA